MTSDASQSAGKAMFVQFERRGGAIVAKVCCSSIGQREAEILTRDITDACDGMHGDRPTLVVDCSDLTFINSMGLSCFINLNNHLKKRKGRVVLFGLNEQLCQVFKITRIDQLFTIENDPRKLEKFVGA